MNMSLCSITPVDNVPVILFINQCPPQNQHMLEAGSHILRCDYEHSLPLNQDHTKDLKVECDYRDELYELGYDTQVRLLWAGAEYNSSGFVEVYLNGSWGPVCNLGQYDADTVCRQLGYTSSFGNMGHGSSVHPEDFLPDNTVTVTKLDHFTCSSNSSDCLRDCFSYPPPNYEPSCTSGYSWVNCTFDENKAKTDTAGSFAKCSGSHVHNTTTSPTHHPQPPSLHTLLIILPVAVGVLVLVLLAVVPLLCWCRCVLHRQRRNKDNYMPLNDNQEKDEQIN